MQKLICFLVLFSSITAFSQDKNAIVQQRVEFISEQLETEQIDLTNVVEYLNYRFDEPINLNGANRDELEELALLTDVQVNDLLLHIRKFGKLITIYELQTLTYWDMETIRMVLPFIRVDDKLDQLHVSFKEAIKNGNFEAFFRYQRYLEDKRGYENVSDSLQQNSNSHYYGNPDKLYTRLRFKYRTNLSVGLTAEKDPGEQFFKGAQKNGFDFYSAHAFYKGGKYLRGVALGDYQVQIGQGLNLWSGYAFGKTADVANVKKNALPIKPYTSVDETRFLRGAAVDLGYKNFELTAFGSIKKVDATTNIDTLAEEDLEFVSSINLTGFHRTNSEIERKNGLTEKIMGGNLRYEKRGLHIGAAGIYWGYDKPYNKNVQPYNQFDFRGKEMYSASMDYSYVLRNMLLFGETSYASFSQSFANLHGMILALDSRASLSLVYRNYQRGYQTFYNAGFAESSRAQNETGLYAGLKLALSKNWSINTYMDFFEFPWMRYQTDQPSQGHEFMVQPMYRPSRNLQIYARFRQQMKEKNSRNSDGSITPLEEVMQRNYRINLRYKLSDAFRVKSRIEFVTVDRQSKERQEGILLSQDLQFKPKSFPLEFALRYALFETDSYDARIYTYESNALYVFSVPAYYYQGSRAYVLLRYKFLRKFDLWVKYGAFLYANRKTLGSGAEQISVPRKSDLTIQLRMKL